MQKPAISLHRMHVIEASNLILMTANAANDFSKECYKRNRKLVDFHLGLTIFSMAHSLGASQSTHRERPQKQRFSIQLVPPCQLLQAIPVNHVPCLKLPRCTCTVSKVCVSQVCMMLRAPPCETNDRLSQIKVVYIPNLS